MIYTDFSAVSSVTSSPRTHSPPIFPGLATPLLMTHCGIYTCKYSIYRHIFSQGSTAVSIIERLLLRAKFQGNGLILYSKSKNDFNKGVLFNVLPLLRNRG